MLDLTTFMKYAGVSATLILSGFGLPIPEEIPIVTAGALVGHDAQTEYSELLHGALGGGPVFYLVPSPRSTVRWWIMLPVCIVSVVIGDSVLFLVGRIWGSKLLKKPWVQRKILPLDKQAKIEQNFHKHGIMILLGARLTPGIRMPVFLMAGVLRMPIRRFLIADALYAIPGVNLLFWLAYWFTDQFVEAIHAVERHRPLVVLAVLSAIIGVVLYKFLMNRKISTGDVDEIPSLVKPVGVVTHAIEQTIELGMSKTVDATAHVLHVVTHPLGHTNPEHQPANTNSNSPTRPLEQKQP